MTNFSNLFITYLFFIVLVSCGGGGQTDTNKLTKQETPKALQDDKLEIESYNRSADLTEELYQELVDKTPALKKLEGDLDALRPKSDDLKAKFNKFDSKSKNYYSSANYKASTISDSLLRMKITELIISSSKKYTIKTEELNSLINQISKNGSTLNDNHSVLKIMLTLPLIDKYEDGNKPQIKEYKDLINEQGKLILCTDSLTPKY